MKNLFLIDGSGFIFRAFYALPPLTNPKGIPINAVYGYCNMILNINEKFRPEQIIVVFDTKKKPRPRPHLPHLSIYEQRVQNRCIENIIRNNIKNEPTWFKMGPKGPKAKAEGPKGQRPKVKGAKDQSKIAS